MKSILILIVALLAIPSFTYSQICCQGPDSPTNGNTVTCESQWGGNKLGYASCISVDDRVDFVAFFEYIRDNNINPNDASADKDGWALVHFVVLSNSIEKINAVNYFEAYWHQKTTHLEWTPLDVAIATKNKLTFQHVLKLSGFKIIPKESLMHAQSVFMRSEGTAPWLEAEIIKAGGATGHRA